MIEKRKFHRISLIVDATVYHQDCQYEGVLSSISLGGASFNFNDNAMLPQGDICYISFNLYDSPVKFKAKIVNSSVYRIGIAFTEMSCDQSYKLSELLMMLTLVPESQQLINSLFVVT